MITHAGKKDLVDAHTSKTKRSFADIQQKVLHDPVAGGMGHPLQQRLMCHQIASGVHCVNWLGVRWCSSWPCGPRGDSDACSFCQRTVEEDSQRALVQSRSPAMAPHSKECTYQILNAHHSPLDATAARISNASISFCANRLKIQPIGIGSSAGSGQLAANWQRLFWISCALCAGLLLKSFCEEQSISVGAPADDLSFGTQSLSRTHQEQGSPQQGPTPSPSPSLTSSNVG
ncbi:TPA: hypothetical protein ACH3X2_012662 [Trebouxia sp. C0005]